MSLAAARQKGLDPQNCLSCGESELKQVSNNGLIGLHTRDRFTQGLLEASPPHMRTLASIKADGSSYGHLARSNLAICDNYDS
jgi:hypothetical protein